jgi:hypothetical protein
MAFEAKNLSVLAYANGFTMWHYATLDGAAQVDTTGYFNPAAEMLRRGDMIFANVDTGGAGAAGIFLVSQSSGGQVDVSDMTTVGATDTD